MPLQKKMLQMRRRELRPFRAASSIRAAAVMGTARERRAGGRSWQILPLRDSNMDVAGGPKAWCMKTHLNGPDPVPQI